MSGKNQERTTIQEIRKNSRQLVRELDVLRGVYLDTGYTFSQCHVMFELAAHGSLGLIELSEILLIDKSNTSRTVKQLVTKGLVKSKTSTSDSRQKVLSITAKGQKVLLATVCLADEQVRHALENLPPSQWPTVIQGLRLYGNALRKSRLQLEFSVRPIRKSDDPSMANVIREVMTEFGAVGDGYSINDAEVCKMYASYRDKRMCYFVIEHEGLVVGGGGIGPLVGGIEDVCELRKMFFLPTARGIGLGQRLLLQLLEEARKRGFTQCYLETLGRMKSACALYEKNGFQLLDQPMGNTGHCSCDASYLLDL